MLLCAKYGIRLCLYIHMPSTLKLYMRNPAKLSTRGELYRHQTRALQRNSVTPQKHLPFIMNKRTTSNVLFWCVGAPVVLFVGFEIIMENALKI